MRQMANMKLPNDCYEQHKGNIKLHSRNNIGDGRKEEA
jgi:hypothetical protein